MAREPREAKLLKVKVGVERVGEKEDTSAGQILIKLPQDSFSGEKPTSCSLAGNLKLSRNSILSQLMNRHGRLLLLP